MSEEMTIVREPKHWVPFGLPESEGVFMKIYRVDEAAGRAVIKVRFEAGASAPRHYHFCTAVAYTLSGHWEYDEGDFWPGDVAVEPVGNNHQPSSDQGTEMMLVFDTDNGLLLDNYLTDGSVIRIGLSLLQAMNGKTTEDLAGFDPMPHITFFESAEAAEAAR